MPEQPLPFGEAHAATYDEQFAKLAAMRDVMHLLTRLVLADLPDDARILSVGAGTGAEILFLAEAFPSWHFTAVEPAPAMLAVCRQRTEAIAERCTYHEGYIDSLPPTEPFHAATSLLVSHFIDVGDERSTYYREIASRLVPQGWLVNAELAKNPAHDRLFPTWLEAMRFNGMSADKMAHFRETFSQHVKLLPTGEVETLIASAGFDPPVPFLQTLLIHGWYTRRT